MYFCFKDDDAIISWHWDLTSGPIGYQTPLQDGPTLVLKDLKQPGNYTFRLTVEDSDHVKNSTTANITVLNHTDYPPEANAGKLITNRIELSKTTKALIEAVNNGFITDSLLFHINSRYDGRHESQNTFIPCRFQLFNNFLWQFKNDVHA